MREWIHAEARQVAARAETDLRALVDEPSPTGDVPGANAAAEALIAQLPEGVAVERIPSSTPGYAHDVRARLSGTGTGRILLLGHLDTVSDDGVHRRLRRDGALLRGTGAFDMKGGLVIACGVLRALAGRPELHERVDLLCVTDEEWREVPLRHVPAPGEYHACLTFEGAERVDGREAIVVRRRAAAVVRVTAHGTGAHAGSSASDGRSALLALAELAPKLAAVNDPAAHVSVVPTVLRAGEALNAVPSTGELVCDVRAFDTVALEQVLGAVPAQMGDVRLNASSAERFPPMDTEIATTPWIEQAGALLGEPLVPVARGGASDAAFCAPSVPHTIDGLGPVGGGDHSAAEYVEADSFEPRARIAIALAVAALEATR